MLFAIYLRRVFKPESVRQKRHVHIFSKNGNSDIFTVFPVYKNTPYLHSQS